MKFYSKNKENRREIIRAVNNAVRRLQSHFDCNRCLKNKKYWNTSKIKILRCEKSRKKSSCVKNGVRVAKKLIWLEIVQTTGLEFATANFIIGPCGTILRPQTLLLYLFFGFVYDFDAWDLMQGRTHRGAREVTCNPVPFL